MPEGTQPVDDPIAIVRQMIEIGWNLHQVIIEGAKLTKAHVAHETGLHALEEQLVRLQTAMSDVDDAEREVGMARLRIIAAKLRRDTPDK